MSYLMAVMVLWLFQLSLIYIVDVWLIGEQLSCGVHPWFQVELLLYWHEPVFAPCLFRKFVSDKMADTESATSWNQDWTRDSEAAQCRTGTWTNASLVLLGWDSPSVAAVTQGRGERLLGVMLVGNAILKLGEGREKAQYVKSEPTSCTNHTTGENWLNSSTSLLPNRKNDTGVLTKLSTETFFCCSGSWSCVKCYTGLLKIM